MYAVGDTLPVAELDAGAFLLAGPAMSGKSRLLLDLLVGGVDDGDGVLLVTTNRSSAQVLESIEDRLGTVPDRVLVVDCVTDRDGADGPFPEGRVEYVSSPADLTGVGIGVSEGLRRLTDAGAERVRLGFSSLSTLLMYADVETVFRFLHVLTGRLDSVEGVGFFVLDPTTQDPESLNTLKQLFDGMIELRGDDAGEREVRLVGVPDASGDWTPLP